ncbi:MAG: sodium:proton antiporter [bacterium]|nr:sodium:proton antiporter [bacterium]
MTQSVMIELASILVLGTSAQWLAWRIKAPSILILLLFGIVAGPVTKLINPNLLLGDMLYPIVSILVSIVIFEGGLSLRIADLKNIGKEVRNLIGIGTPITYFLIILGSYFILGFSKNLAIIFGAMMVMTGPTVILPLLRQVKLGRHLSSLIRWEGILIEPVGVLLIVFSHQFVLITIADSSLISVAINVATVILVGGIFGAIGAGATLTIIKRKWAPDDLQEVLSFMLVILVFVASNVLIHDSGIIAVVIMGMVLANQRKVMVRHIIVFKENLRILAISSLFIILAASLPLETIKPHLHIKTIVFLAFIILVVRPIAAIVATIGTRISWRERLFLAWMAPRGIVTAAVASLFALRLTNEGLEGAAELVPLTFIVIFVTVAIYGLTAGPLQRLLKISDPTGDGFVFVGANQFSRKLALAFKSIGVETMLVDTNRDYVIAARLDNLLAYNRSIFSELNTGEIQMGGFGKLLALTGSDEVNTLSNIQYEELLGRENVYRLLPESTTIEPKSMKKFDQGKSLFGKGITLSYIRTRLSGGATIKILPVPENYTWDRFAEEFPRGIAVAITDKDGRPVIIEIDHKVSLENAQKIVALV